MMFLYFQARGGRFGAFNTRVDIMMPHRARTCHCVKMNLLVIFVGIGFCMPCIGSFISVGSAFLLRYDTDCVSNDGLLHGQRRWFAGGKASVCRLKHKLFGLDGRLFTCFIDKIIAYIECALT